MSKPDTQSVPPFTILPATPEDASALHQIIQKTFAHNLFRQHAMPKSREHLTPRAELDEWRLRNLRNRLSDPEALILKAVLTAQPARLIGFADLQRPPPAAAQIDEPTAVPIEGDPEADQGQEEGAASAMPACFDPDLHAEMGEHLEAWQSKIWGSNDQYFSLEKLGVDPAFQRQGVAKLLLEQCLARADAQNLPMYLEAMPGSAEMYGKFGFEERGRFEMLEGRYVVTLMVREARKVD